MKALTLLALFLLATQVYSQTQPVAYNTLSRTITSTTSATFLTNQRLPACYQVDYLVSDLTSISEGNLYSVLYVPRTDINTPAPSGPVTIQLFRGTSTAPVTPVDISSVISTTVESITYLSQAGGCPIAIDDVTVTRSAGNANSGCGLNYYCSGFTNTTNDRLWVRITTSDVENDEGILFDLSVRRGNITITTLTVGTTTTTTIVPPTGVTLFKPTVAQKHYKVNVGPAGSSITQVADFLTLNNPAVQLRITLSNLKVNGVAAPAGSSQGEWSLNVNFGDIAQADSVNLLATDPSQPCLLVKDQDPSFYQSDQKLEVIIPGCSVTAGTYYIDVGLPQTTSSYTYDLLVTWEPINNNNYIPTYTTLNSGVYVNDVIGYYTQLDAKLENIYLLNLSPSNFQNGSYFFVTVFGVDFGSVSFDVTQGCFSYGTSCSSCNTIASCNSWSYNNSPNPDVALDYCKVKVGPCDTTTNQPFFVTVRANPYFDYYYVDYSIQFDIRNTNPIDITTLTSVQGNGYVEYSYIGKVDEMDYNHFVYTVPTSSVTEFYHLTAQLYVNQEEDEVIFAHNADSLAGSGPFITKYNAFEGGYYIGQLDSPYDDCYSYDYACNTLYKDVRHYDGYSYFTYIDPMASCTAVLPYCDILNATKHYFSVYAVNSSPNSYWGEYYNYPGTGYARPVEYTLVFTLWTSAQELQPGEVINQYVVQENIDYYFVNSNVPYLSNWYTHQYVVNIPNDDSVYDSVRVVLGDISQSSFYDYVAVYAKCGSAAGECPCFANFDYACFGYDDRSPSINPYFEGVRTCQLYIPLCECEGPIYLSVRSFVSNPNFRPTAYTLTAFLEGTKSSNVQNIPLPSTSSTYDRELTPNVNFDPIYFNQFNFRFFILEFLSSYSFNSLYGEHMLIYDSDLFVVPVSSIAANRGLQFTIRYTPTPGATERQQFAIMSIAKDVVPPSNPMTANCSSNCIAAPNGHPGSTEGWSYCTIILDPCQVSAGNYYIRVAGASVIESFAFLSYYNPYLNTLDYAGISYSLTVTQNNQAAVPLAIGTPLRDSIHESQYKHYSLAVPSQSNTAMRIHLYRNADQGAPLTLYLNTAGGLAGNGPCYSYSQQCQIVYGDESSVCDFFIPMCDFAQIAGKTIFLSVENQNFNPNFTSTIEFTWYNTYFPSRVSHVPGDMAIQYTLSAQLLTIQSLDLNRGAVVVGNLYEHSSDYYSYTVTQADITAGKILNVEVESIEPYRTRIAFKTTFSTTSPAAQVTGDCACSDYSGTWGNNFQIQFAPCDLTAGTTYLTVKALLDGFNTPFDPISYTVKAYYTVPLTQSLSLSTAWTVAPHPLNFKESVVYSISVTASQNQVVQIEIADLPSTRDSFYADGIIAYLNFGVPGSDSCNLYSCSVANNEDPATVIPAGTVMCRFTITPCTDCTGTYYLSVLADMVAPEPRIQYRSNYTVRAYTTTINTLDQFPSNYRPNATVVGGFNFAIQNTVNPTIQCDNRWGTVVYQDFFFRLPSVTINQYEQFLASNSGSNPGNVAISFETGVSPDRNGACGCDTNPGGVCTLATGCTTGAQTIDVYSRVGLNSCGGFTNNTVNGVQFNTQILADRTYTALNQITVTAGVPATATLARGQYVVLRYSASSINFNLLPTLSFNIDLSLSGGSVTDRTCFVFGTGNLNAVTFPGSVAASSSYCNLCAPMTASTLTFDGCCVDSADVLLLTVYNPPSGPASYNFTFTATVTNEVQIYDALSLPISRTYSSVRDDLATTFSFILNSADFHADDVLNFRIASGNGTATAYINSNYYANSVADCANWFFSCATDASNCNFQFPPCFFAGDTNGIGYNQFFVSIEATSAPFVGPVTVTISVQRTTTISFPSSSNSGLVPDVASTPVDYLVHYKFQYPRTVGDMLLSGNNVALQVQLTPTSTANNSLLLSINDPRFSAGANPLAGSVSGGNPVVSVCDYHNDPIWTCFATNNTALTTRNTAGSVGVTCQLKFCANGVSQAELAKLYSNEFVYLSVQNVESVGRIPTAFTVGVSVVSTAIPTTQVLYNVNPSHSNTDQNFTTTCTNTTAINGGCNYSPSASVDTAYYLINLSSIGSWGVNDYLLVNFTNVVSTLTITLWANDECEPDVGTTTLTCNVGQVCALQGDPCQFTSLYRADNGANTYVTEARNLYLRVRGLTSTSSFNIAVLQVTPLQITVPLSASSLTYSATFQSWEGRWTMFNFILPKNEMYDFDVSITSDCGTSTEPRVYLNEYSYQWASESCSEITLGTTTPFSWTHYSCELDGNFFISVYTPLGSLQYSPIVIPEGRVSPQVQFTIEASLTKVVPRYSQYIWESDVSITAGLPVDFGAIGDNENYGTGLSIQLALNNDGYGSSGFLSVITPLFRETYEDGYSFPVPIGDYNTAFFTASSFCDNPVCGDPGVYCCTDSDLCVINIPPCEYRNGRYFIYASTNVPAVLSSRIYRQDYITLALGSNSTYALSATGTLPLGTIFGSNVDLNYYQFYEITITGDPFFLHVQISSNVKELIASYYNYADLEDYYIFGGNYLFFNPTLQGSLTRGDTGLSTSASDCSTYTCSTFVPGVCDFGELECVDTTYFLGVWFTRDIFDSFSECSVLRYDVAVVTRDFDPITIKPDIPVCGTVQGSPDNFNSYGGVPTKKREYFYRFVDDDDDHPEYPTSVTYFVDLTGIDTTTDDVAISAFALQSEFPEQLVLSVSTTGPPSFSCNECSVTTSPFDYYGFANLFIQCGDYSELWITVSTTADAFELIFDYTVEVSFTKYSALNPTIPSLTFGVPSTVSFNLVAENSVLPFTTNNHQRALIRPDDLYIAGTSDYNNDCGNGCPEVETGCLFLGAEPTYYVYYSASLDTDVQCFETPITSVSSSIQVQSVHTLTVPTTGSVDVSSYIQDGGYELIYVPLPAAAADFTVSALNFYIETSIQTDVFVEASCEGFTAGAGCTNTVLFSFTEDTFGTFEYYDQSTCGCEALYLTVSQIASCGSGTTFTLGVQVENVAIPFPVVPLTNNVYIADTLPVFGYANPTGVYKIYSISSTSDNFVHASINRVNNTAGANGHSVDALLLDSNGCLITSCDTGVYSSQAVPARSGNSEDSSCYLYSQVPANQPYFIYVSADETIAVPPASAATYRIKPIVSYVDLEATATQNFQLVGFDRQYYKVNGRAGGLLSNPIQSVVITLNLIDGDRVAIIVADRPSYIDLYETQNTDSYSGWARSKVCYFGTCTIEISTRAQHPGANIFYVWVETVTTTDSADYRVEKQVNYQISATTGLNNCESSSNFITGFCASTVTTLSNVYSYRDANARNLEAQARFNNFLCRCQPPTADCLASLTRFSCLESFRECDSRGFWTPICRTECESVEDTCGSFIESDGDCSCTRPEFACTNYRYSDVTNGACTGRQVVPTPQPSASSSPLPSGASQSRSRTSSPNPSTSEGASRTSSRTPSPRAGASHSSTPAPSQGGNSNDITIKYYIIYENAASSLVPSTLLFLSAIFFFLF